MASCSSLRSAVVVLGCVAVVTASSVSRGASSDDESHGGPSAADATTASSDEPDSEDVATNVPEKKTVAAEDKTYSHKGQFNLRLAFGGGYRIVMRYSDSPLVARTLNDDGKPQTLRGFGSSLALESAIGYAPLAGVEPFLWGRFGLTRETVSRTSPLIILGAGVRLYTMSDAAFKFFIEPAVGVELENGYRARSDRTYTDMGVPVRYKQDFIVRLTIGPQFDLARNVGIYATAGLTAGMLRALQSWMDLNAGVQARFP
jgi:hypothetical protein